MSVQPHIQCDSEDPDVGGPCFSYDYPGRGMTTATEVRAYLRTQGWHRTKDGRDLCPACWERGVR